MARYHSLLDESWRLINTGSARRSQNRSLVDLVLGTGPIDIFGLDRFQVHQTWDAPIPRAPSPEPIAPAEQLTTPPMVLAPKLLLKSSRAHPVEEEAVSRSAALRAWIPMLEIMKGATLLFIQLKGELTEEGISPYLATRRTSTLAVRASAFRLFLKWADEVNVDPEDLDERMAFAYLSFLQQSSAPPSRAESFVKGCNFAYHLFGLTRGQEIAMSARCRGLAAVSLSAKRRRIQRDPLQMSWLALAEEEIVLAGHEAGRLSAQEGCVLGFLVFCVHARQRCTDGARITDEPTLDIAEGEGRELASFIEAVTTGDAIKTGNVPKLARLQLPVVGLALGVSGRPWAQAWSVLRTRCGLNAQQDACLMREPLIDGTFAVARIQPGSATQWLRHLLLKLGVEASQLRNVGSHSCKTTLLSVAAKGGLSRDDRRTLGTHAVPGDSSVDCYSRDNLAAPLLNLAVLLRHVREGRFAPDASRSGRWTTDSLLGIASGSNGCKSCNGALVGQKITACECGAFIHVADACCRICQECHAEFCLDCVWFEKHACTKPSETAYILAEESDDSADTEHDSDGEIASMTVAETEDTLIEAHAKLRFLAKGVARGNDALVPDNGIFFNRITGTAHMVAETDSMKSACGLKMSPLIYEFASGRYALDECSLCWRAGCCNWIAAPDDDSAFDFSPTSPAPIVSEEPALEIPPPFDITEEAHVFSPFNDV